MNADTTTVIIAVVSAVLGAPFLNFLLSLTRARADKDSVVVAGAGSTVTAMQSAVDGLRGELGDVRRDLRVARQEARDEIDEQAREHRAQVQEIRVEHRTQLEAIRKEHEKEMVRVRVEHRREMQALERRLTGETPTRGPHQ